MRVTEPKSYHDCWDLVKANIAREDTVLIYHEPVLIGCGVVVCSFECSKAGIMLGRWQAEVLKLTVYC
jgi:hypothetical protein